MRARIRERLKATRKTQKDASLFIGMGQTYVHDFLKGGKAESFKFDLLPKLAEFLECDPRYLTGEAMHPDGSGYEELTVEMMIGADPARVQLLTEPIFVNSDIRYRPETQIAWLISGDEWKDAGVRDGSIVVTSNEPGASPKSLAVAELVKGGPVLGRVSENGNGIQLANGDVLTNARILGVVVMELQIFQAA